MHNVTYMQAVMPKFSVIISFFFILPQLNILLDMDCSLTKTESLFTLLQGKQGPIHNSQIKLQLPHVKHRPRHILTTKQHVVMLLFAMFVSFQMCQQTYTEPFSYQACCTVQTTGQDLRAAIQHCPIGTGCGVPL